MHELGGSKPSYTESALNVWLLENAVLVNNKKKGRAKFSEEEWKSTDALRRCNGCVPKRCCSCRKARGRFYFDAKQWALDKGTAICHDCDRKRCASCSKLKGHMQFTATMWQLDDSSPGLCCRECTTGKRLTFFWTCQNRQCNLQKPHVEFTKAIQTCGGDATKVNGRARVCNAFQERLQKHRADQRLHNMKLVQKKPQ